jgi:uncharacterized membrane protein
MSEVLGGPRGEHAGPPAWWTPTRVLLAVFTVVFALGLVQKGPCMASHWTSDNVRYGAMCYSDVPYLYVDRGFAEHRWPYVDSARAQPMEYPVVISYVAWAASELTRIGHDGPDAATRARVAPAGFWALPGMQEEINQYFVVTALLLFLAGLLATWLLARVHRGRPWDALPFALSPALLLTGLINWDLLAVLATVGALWAWSRGRPLTAGALAGVGAATKLYPAFVLGSFLVVALRRRRTGEFTRTLSAAVAGWVLLQVPAWASGDLGRWTEFWTFNSHRGADLGSLWLAAQQWGHPAGAHTINTVSLVLFAAACAAIGWLGLRAPYPPRVAQLAFLVVAAFLLVNKVYSPQYVLWLLPLAVLARPRWRDLLVWQATELVYFGAVWLYLGTTKDGHSWLEASTGGTPTYALAIALRGLGELYLCAVVVRDVWWPEHDPARAHLDDDPMTPRLAPAAAVS